MTHRADALHTILTEVHEVLPRRLAAIEASDTLHILMAIGADGMANVAPDKLKAMAEDPGAATDQPMQRPPDGTPVH